jgi:hypothetical protein
MTQEEIIEMAGQAGALQVGFNTFSMQHEYSMFSKELEAFVKLVAAKEREACAKVCEHMAGLPSWEAYQHYLDSAKAIRARGEA